MASAAIIMVKHARHVGHRATAWGDATAARHVAAQPENRVAAWQLVRAHVDEMQHELVARAHQNRARAL